MLQRQPGRDATLRSRRGDRTVSDHVVAGPPLSPLPGLSTRFHASPGSHVGYSLSPCRASDGGSTRPTVTRGLFSVAPAGAVDGGPRVPRFHTVGYSLSPCGLSDGGSTRPHGSPVGYSLSPCRGCTGSLPGLSFRVRQNQRLVDVDSSSVWTAPRHGRDLARFIPLAKPKIRTAGGLPRSSWRRKALAGRSFVSGQNGNTGVDAAAIAAPAAKQETSASARACDSLRTVPLACFRARLPNPVAVLVVIRSLPQLGHSFPERTRRPAPSTLQRLPLYATSAASSIVRLWSGC